MRKFVAVVSLLVGLLAAHSGLWAAPAEKIDFALFVSPSCIHCNRLKQEYLPELKEKYKDTVNFIEYNIMEEGNSIIFADTSKEYGITDLAFPTAIVGSTYMTGYPTEIKTYSDTAIEKAQLLNEKTNIVDGRRHDSKSVFQKITFWAIIGSGLIDGINPCAFAVIVFFISFLTVYKYTRREIVIVGVSYCLAVFAAYVLIGIGLFQFLYAMRSFFYVIKTFYVLTALLCLGFFALSLYDFWIYQKTKRADKMLLQLPKSLKERIHKIMGFFLRDKNKSTWRLVLAALAVGFGVSLVEAVCTGQVYLPTVVLIMQDPAFRLRAVVYLLLYNLMFIVPLVMVFILALVGYESKGFNEFLKKHLGITKLLLCVVFLGLFLLLISNIL